MTADAERHWPEAPRRQPMAAGLAALTQGPPRLLLIEGEPGVGKTSLASAIAASLGGPAAMTVIGTVERAATPLGAFDDALERMGIADTPTIAEVVATLTGPTAPAIVVVDDAPRLDSASSEVIRRLVQSFGVRALATARAGEPLPPPLQALDDEGLIHRQPLGGLDADEVHALLATVFRVPAREEDVNQLLWETGGNALHLRVVVESAIEAGDVVHRGDRVEIRRPIDPSTLSALIAARVTALSPEAHTMLWVVALAQPVHLDGSLIHPGRATELTELLRGGLVSLIRPADRLMIAHPLVAESLDPSTRSDEAVDEAVRVLRSTRDPARRFAAVDLEHRHRARATPEELVWAAGYAAATGEHRLAATLAADAMALPAGRATAFAAHLAAARYASLAHDLDAAERLLLSTEALAREPGERAALASAVGEHLAFRREDPAAAVAQGQRVRATLSAPESVALDADLWRWHVLAERGRTGDATTEAHVRAAIAASVAASMRGEPAAARAASEPLRVPRALLGPLASEAAIALGLQRWVELRAGGTAADAAAFLEAARAEASDEVGFFTLLLAMQHAHEGRLVDGMRFADLAVDQLRRWDGGELLALALALQATINAQRGATALARRQLSELDGLTVSGAAVLQRAECQAYLLAADGDTVGAADTILEVVDDAVSSGYRVLGALTLSTALRFGSIGLTAALAERLCDGLAEVVEPCVALRDVAIALAQGRPDEIPAAAQRLARAGLVTTAIDSTALALALPAPESTRRRLHAVAQTLSVGVDAPLLQPRIAPTLTPREMAVARLAAERRRTREIAEQLGVSARTVENQLHAVYRKLGIASRDELRIVLGQIGLIPEARDEDQPPVGDAP